MQEFNISHSFSPGSLSKRQRTGTTGPWAALTTSSIVISEGSLASMYPPLGPRLLLKRPALRSLLKICSRYLWEIFSDAENKDYCKNVFSQFIAGFPMEQPCETIWLAKDGTKKYISWSFGILHIDEIDKVHSFKAQQEKDINANVQSELLRLLEGNRIQLQRRRYERESTPLEFDSNGTCFVLSGAFDGLRSIIEKSRWYFPG